MEKYTPMMMQYLKIKNKYPDTLILFRLGDFYELFFDDAKIASRELQLALTGKSAGTEEKVPMCGVPHHAISSYIDKLIAKGYKVGICEQLEDPKLAKGIVERDIIQIITPGAFIDIKDKENNYIASLGTSDNFFSFAYSDVSTGEVYVENIERSIDSLVSELENLNIKELVVSTSFPANIISQIKERYPLLISYENDDKETLEHQNVLEFVREYHMRETIVRLLNYLKETQRKELDYLKKAQVLKRNGYLQIDNFSRINLELTKTIRNETTYGTLLWLLDQTSTNMGSRLLKQWINKPLADEQEILKRQSVIASLMDKFLIRADIKQELKDIYDLERLCAKISFGSCNGRDLLQLKKSLSVVPSLKKSVEDLNNAYLNTLPGIENDFKNLTSLLEKAISDDAPITVKDGEIFKKGYNAELDELITLSTDSRSYLAQLEAREKERTGIKTLRIGYNKVFGYYLEVSKGAVASLPADFNYERKQTTVNSERFVSQELRDYENKVLNAMEKRKNLEYVLFNALRDEVNKYTEQIQNLATFVSTLDALLSLTEVSLENHYVCPTFNHERNIHIIDGRHPVLEKVSSNYIPNSIILDKDTDIQIITGPNMGGKSTYMRQLALIVVLAQIGSYVPCAEASLPIFDAIYTRIGASDNLVSGQSTFMVEMSETNFALRHATSESLLLFDEIGRGTATFDGMALAEAILEYIAQKIKAKTLFSTHYHEITKIEEKLPTLKNVHVAVDNQKDKITFLYKVLPGAMNRSYGINVASLASLPDEVINRAKQILSELENNEIVVNQEVIPEEKSEKIDYIEELKTLDVYSMSPLEALNYLYNLQKKAKGK